MPMSYFWYFWSCKFGIETLLPSQPHGTGTKSLVEQRQGMKNSSNVKLKCHGQEVFSSQSEKSKTTIEQAAQKGMLCQSKEKKEVEREIVYVFCCSIGNKLKVAFQQKVWYTWWVDLSTLTRGRGLKTNAASQIFEYCTLCNIFTVNANYQWWPSHQIY